VKPRVGRDDDGFVVDLLPPRWNGRVANSSQGGRDELHASLAAEQRYLVEEVGEGAVSGSTYSRRPTNVSEDGERVRTDPSQPWRR